VVNLYAFTYLCIKKAQGNSLGLWLIVKLEMTLKILIVQLQVDRMECDCMTVNVLDVSPVYVSAIDLLKYLLL
jgi:hypothetical protein